MTISKVKFDRYILPMWPALLILAAAGWAALVRLLQHRLSRRASASGAGHDLASDDSLEHNPAADGGSSLKPLVGQPPARLQTQPLADAGSSLLKPLVGLLLLLELGQLAIYHPYYLSYYNPLLGGGAVAQQVFLIGWGEGMDQAGAYLSARPDIQHGPILSALPLTLQPFVPVPVKEVATLGQDPANYAVVYLESLQRQADHALYETILQTEPLARIRIHGIDYATIHQLARPYAQVVDATFSDAFHLRGVTVEYSKGALVITPSWDIRARPAGDYHLFIHMFNQAGDKVMQIDTPVGGAAVAPTGQWLPGEQIAVPLPMGLPQQLTPGAHTLTMGLYDPVSGARLPLTSGARADERMAGPDALMLYSLQLDQP